MKLTKRQLRQVIREVYSKIQQQKLVIESQNPNDYIENMAMGLGYDDAMESTPNSSMFSQALADAKRFGEYEDILMAPDSAIKGLIDRSDAIFELAMEATSGEGYDQNPLADEWRGFIIGILAAG